MFKAIGRYIKAVFALFTGGINGMRASLNTNKYVIAATFDEITDDQIEAIQTMSTAVASMITAKERKVSKVGDLTAHIKENAEYRDGALAMIDELKNKFNLATEEGISSLKATEDYQQASSAYESLSKEIQDDENTLDELEIGIKEDDEHLASRMAQLSEMKDQIEKIKSEKAETIADVTAAKQERQINDMINGISQNDAGERLAEMRQVRMQAKAEAKVGRTLAGTESKARKAKFKNFAHKRKSSSEFDKLLGISKEIEAKTQETTQIPD